MAAKGVDVLNALARYASAAQRTYFKACQELRQGRQSSAEQRAAEVRTEAASTRREAAKLERNFLAYLNAPLPGPITQRAAKPVCKTNPIPGTNLYSSSDRNRASGERSHNSAERARP